MLNWLRDFFSKLKRPARQDAPPGSPLRVEFDPQGILTLLDGQEHERVAWEQVKRVVIAIEGDFLPFPYWYIGDGTAGVRIPNDAQGGERLFFEGLAERLPGYRCDATFQAIIRASTALEGVFLVWEAPDPAA
jgi:hypothetical protein